MHILHLAIFPDVLISLLCDLTDDVRSRDAELDILWNNYKVWCDGQAVPDRASRKLFSSAILKPNAREYATISQKLLSATAARYMIFWLGQLMASLLQRYSRSSSKEFYESLCSNFRIPFYVYRLTASYIISREMYTGRKGVGLKWEFQIKARIRAAVVMALATMEHIMLDEGRAMSNSGVENMKRANLIYRASYNFLSEEALSKGRCRWACRPKMHYLEHLTMDFQPLNGRFFHNYQNEDAVRRFKMIAAGSHAAYLSRHVCLKYSIQACLRWR